MPRKARIDAPGALHHIIVMGIERRKIFYDDTDRENFLDRLETILSDTGTLCFAWALIPNHLHLLLRTGSIPIATVMRRLLTPDVEIKAHIVPLHIGVPKHTKFVDCVHIFCCYGDLFL